MQPRHRSATSSELRLTECLHWKKHSHASKPTDFKLNKELTMDQLIKNAKITQAVTPTAGAAGTSDINATTLDMSGAEGVLIVVTMGAIVGSAATSIKVQSGAASNMSDAADLIGTSQTIADDDDEKVFYIDVNKPVERYVRLVVDRATQNATVSSATYIQYGSRKVAISSHGSNVSGEAHVSPAERHSLAFIVCR